MIRAAVIGAGNMARRRVQALLNTEEVEICGIAANRLDSAKQFAHVFNIPYATDDYQSLLNQNPDFTLIEVPHYVQDEIVLWALQHNLHVLLGSFLATSEATGKTILNSAIEKKRIVECGFEARYKSCWVQAKETIESGVIGDLTFVNAVALWQPPQDSWYGGLPQLSKLSVAKSCTPL